MVSSCIPGERGYQPSGCFRGLTGFARMFSEAPPRLSNSLAYCRSLTVCPSFKVRIKRSSSVLVFCCSTDACWSFAELRQPLMLSSLQELSESCADSKEQLACLCSQQLQLQSGDLTHFVEATGLPALHEWCTFYLVAWQAKTARVRSPWF